MTRTQQMVWDVRVTDGSGDPVRDSTHPTRDEAEARAARMNELDTDLRYTVVSLTVEEHRQRKAEHEAAMTLLDPSVDPESEAAQQARETLRGGDG